MIDPNGGTAEGVLTATGVAGPARELTPEELVAEHARVIEEPRRTVAQRLAVLESRVAELERQLDCLEDDGK